MDVVFRLRPAKEKLWGLSPQYCVSVAYYVEIGKCVLEAVFVTISTQNQFEL